MPAQRSAAMTRGGARVVTVPARLWLVVTLHRNVRSTVSQEPMYCAQARGRGRGGGG